MKYVKPSHPVVWLQWHLLIKEMHPHNYIRYLLLYRNRDFPIELTPSAKMLIGKEWEDWETDYMPKGGVEGKTVLDVGAGSGETAWFYFQHGAKKVICVEPDKVKLRNLAWNAARMGWNAEVYAEPFMPKHMALEFDFAKIDCEGGEELLLDLPWLPPLAMEIHFIELVDRFRKRFPEMDIRKQYFLFSTWLGKIG